ncbi:MAG: polyprenyl synthetase family protein [Planctomycetaceae bacterium]|nr:polyprenyl synthetase family protein [Planctomycetaceae bacterium]
MDSSGKQPVVVPENLRALYAPVAQELQETEELLRRELSSDHPFVDQLVKHGFRLGGKRLRPALVLLSGLACGGLRPEHRTLAAMVELIHTATLIHDDVLDEATVRRHLDTINARWDNETSILLGDYLFAKAMCLAGSLEDPFAIRLISQTTQRVCKGELRQVEGRGDFGLTEDCYFDIIGGKTAALTSCCCEVGAYYAGASPETCRRLADYGRDLGIAFQIADDVLDLTGNETVVGKSLGTDLAKQKATLPLIRLLDAVDDPQRQQLVAILSRSDNHRQEALRPWFERYQAISYARQKAGRFSQQAVEQLSTLSATVALDSLRGLTDFVIARQQ